MKVMITHMLQNRPEYQAAADFPVTFTPRWQRLDHGRLWLKPRVTDLDLLAGNRQNDLYIEAFRLKGADMRVIDVAPHERVLDRFTAPEQPLYRDLKPTLPK